MALSNRCAVKSGKSTSVKYSSAYADCHSKKFERRSSPPVRMIRSGSGISAVYSSFANDCSVMFPPSSAAKFAARTISARLP